MNLFISPHNDDEALFGAYTLLRDKPLVFIATISKKQGNNGLERLRESQKACDILDVPMISSGIYDTDLTEKNLTKILKEFVKIPNIIVYAPEVIADGHKDHNICGKVVDKLFGERVIHYATYKNVNGKAVKFTGPANAKEYPCYSESRVSPQTDKIINAFEKKKEALQCYQSQINKKQKSEFFTNDIKQEYYA